MYFMKDREFEITDARKIYELLSLIESKPLIFLTSKSITALQNFLNGYLILNLGNDDLYKVNEPNLDDFKYWILSQNQELAGIQFPYSRVLLEESKGDEEKAFEKFFIYLNEFKTQR